MILKKNIRLGNKIILVLILILFFNNFSLSEDKISSTPLINLKEIKPSFEELNEDSENLVTNQNLKEKIITIDHLMETEGSDHCPIILDIIMD